MTFQNFVKDNIVLLIGLLLPLVLVVAFVLASALPRMMATPPQYDFLFTKKNYHRSIKTKFDLRLTVDDNGRLGAKAHARDNENTYYPDLYRYRAKDGYAVQVKPEYFLDYLLENKETLADTKNIPVPKSVRGLTLNDEPVSPDGYTLDTTRYRSGGLVGEIFSIHNRRCTLRLVKKNAVFPFEIRQIGNHGYSSCYYSANNLKFLGWIIPEGEE